MYVVMAEEAIWRFGKMREEDEEEGRKEKLLIFPFMTTSVSTEQLGLAARHVPHIRCSYRFVRRGCGTPGALIMAMGNGRSTNLH